MMSNRYLPPHPPEHPERVEERVPQLGREDELAALGVAEPRFLVVEVDVGEGAAAAAVGAEAVRVHFVAQRRGSGVVEPEPMPEPPWPSWRSAASVARWAGEPPRNLAPLLDVLRDEARVWCGAARGLARGLGDLAGSGCTW